MITAATGVIALAALAAGLLLGYSWGHTSGWIERARVVETPDDDPRP